MTKIIILSFASIFAATYASAQAVQKVTVTNAWIRALPSGLPAGGYFTMKNGGDKKIALTGASSPACGMLMFHKSETNNGTATMDDMPSVDVPPHGSFSFAPGGYHLMCMNPAPLLKPGARVPVALEFDDHSHMSVTFEVKNAAGK